MQVDYGFILAAGFGTRMGEVGKILPKLLWPVFNRRLVDLQIAYLKALNIKNIFINSHFLHDELNEYIRHHHPDVSVLFEERVFDIGGGILNFAKKVNFNGRALVINGDQFLMVNNDIILRAVASLEIITLFSIEVNNNEGYNKLVIENNKLKKIIQHKDLKDEENFKTFSGMSLINLKKVTKLDGENHKFFESVANFNLFDVDIVDLERYEYWDFGTIDRYLNSLKKLDKKIKSQFFKFITSNNVKIPKIITFPTLLTVNEEKFIISNDCVEYKGFISNIQK